MGSKGSSSSTFTPPPEVVEAYKEALGYGRAAMGQQYQPYTGEITAPLTPTQESGIYNVNRAVGTAIPYFNQATQLVDQYSKTPIAISNPSQLAQAGQLATGATGVIAPVASPQIAQATQMYGGMAGQTITPQQFSQAALQPYMSPYTQAVADATFRNLREQQMQEQTGLRGGAIRAGAFGGDRAGIAAANMARQQDLATAQAMSNIYNQGYTQATGLFGQQQAIDLASRQADAARQMQVAQQLAGIGTQQQGVDLAARQSDAARQLQAAQQLSAIGLQQQALDFQAQQANKTAQMQAAQQLASLGTGLQGSVLQGAQAQLAAGAQQQAVQQAINSGYYNQYLGAQAYPYQQAQFFANLATGVGGQMGGTTTGTPAQPSPAGSIFGALGALGSIFSASDKRVKENIKPIGKTNDGQTIYRYNFKGDPTTQIGLIAQEVEKKHPEAVRTFNGVKGVDYKEATDDSVRSMGGGVVPSSTRKDFAAGGPSLSDEEDPMIPYKAGVPSKVLQIPKLAKIGGSKPNFGGEPPKSPSGPSEKDFKGAAEGLGKAWNKFNTSDAKVSGFENLGKDFEDMLPASAFSAAFAARGGAIGGLRPRFADGEDVPVTEDTTPIQVASLGDVTRTPVADREPERAPEKEPEPARVGLVPTMARRETDLPPLFSGEGEEAKAAPESEAKPTSVPSMARADTNVPAVKPGLEPAKVPAQIQAAPLTGSDRDAVIRTIIGESGREPYEGQLGVAQVIRNRQLSGRYGKSASDVVYAPKQFSVWNPGDPAGIMANKIDPNSSLYQRIGNMVDQVWAGEAEDPTKGATHFANVATVMAQRGNLQPWLQGMIDSGKTIKIGGHTFGQADAGAYSPSKEGEPSTGGKTLGDIQASYKGPAAEGAEEGKRTQIAAAGKNWPGFGVAGEGKRSIVESLMGKDLDPIQKRAMFAFFAGMAASPSPWFGQQLGAGMQAASNVYNQSMDKQAEIGVKEEQLKLEQQKIGIQEKTKGLEALKYWQSNFEPVATSTGIIYRDKTTGENLTAEQYNTKLNNIMKQYNLAPSDVGATRTGLAPSQPTVAGQASAAQPAAGLIPAPKAPEIAPAPEPGASPAMTLPKSAAGPAPSAAPAPAPQKSEVSSAAEETAKQAVTAYDPKIFENVRDDYNPIKLLQMAEEERKAAKFAQDAKLLDQAKTANERADKYYERANSILENKIPVVFKDNRPPGRIPEIEEEARRVELEPTYRKKNMEEVMDLRKNASTALRDMPEQLATINSLIKIVEEYKPNMLAEEKAKVIGYANAVGIPMSDENMKDAANFTKFIKEQTDLVYKELKTIGGRILQTEVIGQTAAKPSPVSPSPEAPRYLIAKLKGSAERSQKYLQDVINEAPTGVKAGTFDYQKWQSNWNDSNKLDKYHQYWDNEIAARGATPTDSKNLKVGKTYILEPGQYGNTYDRPAKFRYVIKDNRGFMEPVTGNQ